MLLKPNKGGYEMDTKTIYLDHNATTPVAPEAAEAMMPYMGEKFGNPSSGYPLGIEAREAVEHARKEVALLIGAKPSEIIFTSGGTESNNFVLKGVVDFKDPGANHIITCAVEHPSILNPVVYLMELGVRVSIVRVDQYCRVDPKEIEKEIKPETRLISIMLANNETGTLQPIEEISRIGRDHGIPVHTDAAQAVGKIPLNVNDLGVDFLTVAGHKLYGPKGIGALFIREGLSLIPLIHGAGQEKGLRAGTENVILSIGLGAACRVAANRLPEDVKGATEMRDRLEGLLFEGVGGLSLNGHPKERLPNTLNVSVPGLEGRKVLEGIPEIMASTGAACHDRTVKLSHVLSAMGVSEEVGIGALRFSVGRTNTMEQIERAARLIIQRIRVLRDGK